MDKKEIKYLNEQIMKEQAHMAKTEDYVKVINSLLPIVELAIKFSIKVDLDDGQSKKAWRTILNDITVMKKDAEDEYCDVADRIRVLRGKMEDIQDGF